MQILEETVGISDIPIINQTAKRNPKYEEIIERALGLDDGKALVVICESKKKSYGSMSALKHRFYVHDIPLAVIVREEKLFIYRRTNEQKEADSSQSAT